MSARDLHGLIAEFATPEALARAVEAARMAGYTQLEAFSPFPLRDVAEMLGVRPSGGALDRRRCRVRRARRSSTGSSTG